MVRIRGDIDIARPADEVFDVVADERNEPAYNPGIVDVVKLTPGPVGLGTRFEARARRAGRAGVMTVEIVGYDRPRRLTVSVRGPAMHVDGVLTFVAVAGGTRFSWAWNLTLPGAYALLTPFAAVLGPRAERRNWQRLREFLEARNDRPTS